jgi:hypothetical protein
MLPLFNTAQDDISYCHLKNYVEQLKNNAVQEYYDSSLPKTITNSWEDKSINKLNTCSFVEQQNYFDRWIPLYQSFENSFNQKRSIFSNISSDIIFDAFKNSLGKILSLLPEIISVGISDDEFAYIYFEKNNRSVYFDMFFEPEQPTEVAVTIFENKKSKLSFTDYLDNSINILKNEFVKENELSYSPFTELSL